MLTPLRGVLALVFALVWAHGWGLSPASSGLVAGIPPERSGSEPQKAPVGLSNQGNTCYLNSLLQMVFNARPFRDAVLAAPSPGGLLGAIQSCFGQLQACNSPGSTALLTRAMGIDPRFQQDAHEFSQFMFTQLEDEGGMTEAIEELFVGKLANYISATDPAIPEERVLEEGFHDLSVDVQGVSGLEESLTRYITPEVMDGSNQWKTEKHGYQDAEKGLRFLSFPPFLHFHLKRFQYNMNTGALSKVNDEFSFPVTLDCGQWLSTQQQHLPYALTAVVMHVGGAEVGHYYAYVRPDPIKAPSKWYRLDDQVVTPVKESDVLNDAFGGMSKGKKAGASRGGRGFVGLLGRLRSLSAGRGAMGRGATANAYLLQYVSTEFFTQDR